VVAKIEEGEKTIVESMVKGHIDQIEPFLVCEAAINGDKLAETVIEEMVKYLSIGIINLILILNPQIIVLGGDICNLPHVSELILERIIEKVKRSLPFNTPEIKLSSLGEDACIIGASFMAVEYLILGEFPYRIDLEKII